MRGLAVAFTAGLCTLILEMGGSRLLAPYLGNSIYTWSAVIGVVFAGSSAGYYMGSRSKSSLSENALKASICTLLAVPLFALISSFFPFMPPGISHLSGALALALPSFFLGITVTKAIAGRSRKTSIEEASGDIFAISTIGSLAGALLAGFVLIPNVPIVEIFILTSFLMLAASWIAGKFEIVEIVPFGLLAMISIFSLPVPFHDTEILFQEQTPYQLLTVSRAEYTGQNTTAMILDRLVESWEYDNGTMVYDYFERGNAGYQILGTTPRRALVIGFGAGSQARGLQEDFPGIKVDGLEIDPKVVEAGKKYFSLKEDNNTRIIIDDGRRGLMELNDSYDIVLIDVFKGQSAPNHMVSREFFAEVKAKMSPGGILMMNIASNTNGTNSEFFRDLHATLKTQFADVAAFPQSSSGGKFIRQTILLVASDADMSILRESSGGAIYEPGEGSVFTDDWSPADILNPV